VISAHNWKTGKHGWVSIAVNQSIHPSFLDANGIGLLV
jgi:hypothetical protein